MSTVLYYRDGCHLCEELAAMLFRGWPEHTDAIEWRDVDASPEWRSLYGQRVPVLIRDDQLICELKPDPGRIERYFGEPVNQL